MSTLLPSISIDALVQARDLAIEKVRSAVSELTIARDALLQFGVKFPECYMRYPSDRRGSLTELDEADFHRAEVDRNIWLVLFEATHLDTIMDSKTRRELYDSMYQSGYNHTPLPELTADNIVSTFVSLHARSDEFFTDCVESVFRSLSWDHKTNSPLQFGRRLIVNGAFYNSNRQYQGDFVHLSHHESLHDLERVLLLLSGAGPPAHGVGLRALGRFPWGEWQMVQNHPREPVLRIKCHRSGTTHVEILDEGLVVQMNQVLAKRYPNILPSESSVGKKKSRKSSSVPGV